MLRRLGVHTSIAGGIHLSLKRAHALGCRTLQIFSHNPRGWIQRKLEEKEVQRFRELSNHIDIKPIYVHSSYLINLSSPEDITRKKSINLLSYELRLAYTLKADFVVLHPGYAVGQDIKEAIRKARKALTEAYERAEAKVSILLENTAVRKGDISYTIPLISEIIEATPPGCIGGICLDTCHAFASGDNIASTEGLEKLEEEIKKYLSPMEVKLIHLNDSKKPFASKADRHEHIGEGFIGISGFKKFLSFPSLIEVPLILETPQKSEFDDKRNIEVVRKILSEIEQIEGSRL